jgi:serine phosphatase RsbU (regulator of sigma subunit)
VVEQAVAPWSEEEWWAQMRRIQDITLMDIEYLEARARYLAAQEIGADCFDFTPEERRIHELYEEFW